MAEVSIADFEADMIGGKKLKLSKHRGKVLLIVNTASRCGFTPQFAGLEKLWQAYRERGLVVLGFPSNEFGGQDPGSNEDIAEFCEVNYGVSFPMMGKVEVNGAGAHPLFQWLTRAALGHSGIFLYHLRFLYGLKMIEAGRGALVVALTPAVVAAGDWLLFRAPMSPTKAAGIALAMFGCLLVVTNGDPRLLLTGEVGLV